MKRTQAGAIAQAILAQDSNRQAEARRRLAVEAAYLSRKRKVAGFALAGSAVGAVVAYLSSSDISVGVIWGGLASSAAVWFVTHRAPA